jgi:tRNA pseudouridine55 synthase
LARRGVVVDAPATEILVDRLTVTATDSAEIYSYEMVVSSGTYVRAIVRDLGAALGCGAAVASLRRTAIGPLRVGDALNLPAERASLREALLRHLIPIDAMPLDLPSIGLTSPFDAVRFSAGGDVSVAPAHAGDPVLAGVRDNAGRLLGVGQLGGGILKPRLVLPREP